MRRISRPFNSAPGRSASSGKCFSRPAKLHAYAGLVPSTYASGGKTFHGPIIRRQAPASGILRYQQVHRALDDELNAALAEPRGTVVEPYLGHAEVWFDHADRGTSPERREAGRVAVEDESHFIDFQRSAMWIGKEHVFVDHL